MRPSRALPRTVLAVAFVAAPALVVTIGCSRASEPAAGPAAIRDGSPSWSPDGSRIVFWSDRSGNAEIWVMDADGSDPVRLTDHPADEGGPAFSPDGSRIAFDSDRDGDFEIWVIDADGSDPVRLTDSPARDVAPSWSPDGSRVAFMSDREGGFDVWAVPPYDPSAGAVRLTETGSAWFPRFSPDGRELAFHVQRDVHVLGLDSGELIRLTHDPDNGMYPTWSPDGSRIAFMSWRGGNTRIWVMNADGTGQRPLLRQGFAGNAIDPRWSPDGSRIVFTYTEGGLEGGGVQRIYVMDADGGNLTRLTGR